MGEGPREDASFQLSLGRICSTSESPHCAPPTLCCFWWTVAGDSTMSLTCGSRLSSTLSIDRGHCGKLNNLDFLFLMLSLAGEIREGFVRRVADVQRLCKHILSVHGRAQSITNVEQRSALWVSIRTFSPPHFLTV